MVWRERGVHRTIAIRRAFWAFVPKAPQVAQNQPTHHQCEVVLEWPVIRAWHASKHELKVARQAVVHPALAALQHDVEELGRREDVPVRLGLVHQHLGRYGHCVGANHSSGPAINGMSQPKTGFHS